MFNTPSLWPWAVAQEFGEPMLLQPARRKLPEEGAGAAAHGKTIVEHTLRDGLL